ncbi:hypothetical protein OBBRIDRAFT_836948 [Obba rivulosa]|uniref:Sodium/calcium exchanger membrane region domain-containing protein n=1 Tax=Obba rivulosa TaxID=1052685 RepID=A0A8E2ARH7_9APHY|nr:hypothetical protein OBBRIDRAFT_836948 [Obba rivulosa]
MTFTDPEKGHAGDLNADDSSSPQAADGITRTETFTQWTRLFYKGRTEWFEERWNFVKKKGPNPRPDFPITTSVRNIMASSVVNVLLLLIPFAWASHFHGAWGHTVTYSLCFLSIVPLEIMYDWGGEQMAQYLGTELGDLLIITLNNAVEATLGIILLVHCELRLLQSTIVGVVVLHLLLIPGTAFLTGGMQKWQQGLTVHTTELNHSLLLLGVMAILLPTALFAALDRGVTIPASGHSIALISDSTRGQILKMSRGISVLILIVYIFSRVFVHTGGPENENKDFGESVIQTNTNRPCPAQPHAVGAHESSNEGSDSRGNADSSGQREGNPNTLTQDHQTYGRVELQVGPGACLVFLAITVGLMAATAEFLVESIEFVRVESDLEEEWFGLILLPIASFAGDGTVAILRFAISVFNHVTGAHHKEPQDLAQARAIDLSIQFVLFWMPLLVLLGWWIGKPMHLMFDYFELALLLGSCFLVNYVTADAKTNWIEGMIMMTLYLMIAICAWFYAGQSELGIMLTCPGSIAQALAEGAKGS